MASILEDGHKLETKGIDMCYQCDQGMPHFCTEANCVVRGSGPMAGATYREEPAVLLGGGLQEKAAPNSTGHSIQDRDGHLISPEPHLPTRANGVGIGGDLDPTLLKEIDSALRPAGSEGDDISD